MDFNDFNVSQNVKHNKLEHYGVGIVQAIFGDVSILVHWPDKEPSHPDKLNTFRYYTNEFKYFSIVI